MSIATRSGSATPAFIALACVGAFAAGPGAAATPSGSGEGSAAGAVGDPITVTGQYQEPALASPKATAPLLDTPQTVTVIGNQTLEKQNLLTLRDALQTLPGITFGAGEGGGGYGDSINLRGYSANTDITIDGVRDSAQYSRTETFDVEQIEVYNGANSAFNGSGSIGGTINIVQKLPKTRELTVIGLGAGSDGYARATIDSNLRVAENIAFRLNAVAHRNDVPGRDVERYRRWGVAPALTIGIDGPTRLTLAYVHQHDVNVPQYGAPYFPAAGGLPEGVRYGGYYGYRNIDEQRSTLDQATMIFEHDFGAHLSIRNLTRYENIAQRTIVDPPQGTYALGGLCLSSAGVGQAAADGSCTANIAAKGRPAIDVTVPEGYYLPTGPRGNRRDTRNQLGYDQLDLRAHFTTGILEHSAVLGASATWEKYHLLTGRVLRAADGSDPYGLTGLPLIAIAHPGRITPGPAGPLYGNNVYAGPVSLVPSAAQEGERTDYAAYLFDTTKIGRLFEIDFGARWERSRGHLRADTIDITPGPTLGAVTRGALQRQDDALFSWRAGLVFKPTPWASLYVSYANSRTPSIAGVNSDCTDRNGVSTCAFAPEHAANYEIGAKARLGRLLLTAALFRNERSNFSVPSNDPANGAPLEIQDGRARVDGLALGASGNITRAWSIFANYTYLKSKVLQGAPDRCVADPVGPGCAALIAAAPEAGGPLQQTPTHSGSLFTTYTLPFGLQLGYGVTYQGRFAIVTDPAHKIGGHYPMSHAYWLHRLFASMP
ncbi:MAG TPA: TonB-dependent receptor, partial [Sphingomonas sp.]|nr:TonB-dependent receptor [Sphingomonas sp.]